MAVMSFRLVKQTHSSFLLEATLGPTCITHPNFHIYVCVQGAFFILLAPDNKKKKIGTVFKADSSGFAASTVKLLKQR